MNPDFIKKKLLSLGLDSSVSLILSVGDMQDRNAIRLLTKITEKLFIGRVCIKGHILKTKLLKDGALSQISKKAELYFEYTPDIRAYLADHPDQMEQLIRKRVFSSTQYVQDRDSWSVPVSAFFGKEPQVVNIARQTHKGTLRFENPQNILALFTVEKKQGRTEASKEISEFMDKKSGLLSLPPGFKAAKEILVIRYFHLKDQYRVTQHFNYYNLSHARMMQEIFTAKLKKHLPGSKGLFFHFGNIFESCSADCWPEYDFNLERTAPGLLRDIATAWLNGQSDWQAEYNLARKEFFENELKKDLCRMHKQLQAVLPVHHSMVGRMELSAFYLPEIEARRFLAGSPYFFDSLLQIKRLADRRHLQNEGLVPVIIHDLFNLRFSFAEKQMHLNYLTSVGANHFYFNFTEHPAASPADLLQRFEQSGDEIFYLPDWLSRFHQSGHFFKHSGPCADILVLYPVYDKEHDEFKRVVHTLDEQNLSYTYIDFDLFNKDGFCTIREQRMICGQAEYAVILLPSIHTLPLDTIKRLAAFVRQGGIVLALGCLPALCREANEQERFDQIKENIWFEGSEPGGTSFKRHDSGGLGLYQKNLSKLNSLWQELDPFLRFQLKIFQGQVRHIMQEGEDKYYLFLLNDGTTESYCEVQTVFSCRPYEWNFDQAESFPYPFWYMDEQKMYISLKLAPAESRLLLLSKKESPQIPQILFSTLDGAEINKQNSQGIALEGWRRKSGSLEMIIQKNGLIKKIKKNIPEKRLILRIHSRSWYLDSENYKGKINLGDHSKLYPFESAALTYQKLIVLDKTYTDNYRLFLDLGKVRDWCLLHINDQYAGKKFSPPFIFDISSFLKKGENKISITVFHAQSNTLAKTNDEYPLREYGLFGPVKITPYGKIYVEYTFD